MEMLQTEKIMSIVEWEGIWTRCENWLVGFENRKAIRDKPVHTAPGRTRKDLKVFTTR